LLDSLLQEIHFIIKLAQHFENCHLPEL